MLGLVARAFACDDVVTADMLVSQLMMADHDGAAPARARAALPCVSEPITPLDAALYHRVMARDALTRGAELEAVAEMRAARAGDPDWTPPPSLAALFARAQPDATAPSLVMPRAIVDGVDGGAVHLDRAVIVQSLEDTEWRTRYMTCVDASMDGPMSPVTEGDRLVPLAVIPPVRPTPAGIHVARRKPLSVPFLITSAALGAGSIGAFGVSAVLNAQFHDLENPNVHDQDQLAVLGDGTNAAAGVAIAAGVLAAFSLTAATVTVTFE